MLCFSQPSSHYEHNFVLNIKTQPVSCSVFTEVLWGKWSCLSVQLITQVLQHRGLDIYFTAETLELLCACLLWIMMYFAVVLIAVQSFWDTMYFNIPLLLFFLLWTELYDSITFMPSPTRQHSAQFSRTLITVHWSPTNRSHQTWVIAIYAFCKINRLSNIKKNLKLFL
jgi:hypothetical protein